MADYYCDGLSGNDANSGLVGSPVRTIAVGVGLLTAPGDILNVKQTAAPYAGMTAATTVGSGTAALPKKVCGYAATPGDGGRPTILGGSQAFNLGSLNFWHIRSFVCQSFTTQGVVGGQVHVEDCDFLSNGVTYANRQVQGTIVECINCNFDGDGGGSGNTVIYSNGNARIINCLFTNHAKPILGTVAGPFYVWGCRVFNCTATTAAFNLTAGVAQACLIAHNSFDTISGDAIAIADHSAHQGNLIFNNAICNLASGKAGIRSADVFGNWFGRNAFFNCPTKYAGGTVSRGGDVDLAGLPWAGAGDFTPLTTPAGLQIRRAGVANWDMGAVPVSTIDGGSFWILSQV